MNSMKCRKYTLGKNRYRELYYFCQQYGERKRKCLMVLMSCTRKRRSNWLLIVWADTRNKEDAGRE